MKELSMKVANDNGNSAVKMIINDGQVIESPNVYARVRTIPNNEELDQESFINNIEKNLILAINSKTSGTYFVGDYAKKSGQVLHNMQLGIFGDKTESEVYPITTLAHIAGQAVKETLGNEDDLRVVTEMVGAIPINQYSKDKANTLADKFMEQSHINTVHLPQNTINVSIRFSFVKILPEGVPPVYYMEQKDEKYTGKNILHVNIGEGTTELPVTNGRRFNPNFIRGVNHGVGHAVERVLEEFRKAAYMPDNFNRQQFMDIIKNPSHKFYATAHSMLVEELEVESESILSVVLQEIAKANNEIDFIVIYGGGAILMRKFLQKKIISIAKKINAECYYATNEEATTIEVKGIKAFMESDIYLTIKEMNQAARETIPGQLSLAADQQEG